MKQIQHLPFFSLPATPPVGREGGYGEEPQLVP